MNFQNLMISLLLVVVSPFCFSQVVRPGQMVQVRLENEYVAVVAKRNLSRFFGIIKNFGLQTNLSKKLVLSGPSKLSVVKIKASINDAVALARTGTVEVIGENYLYLGDPREGYNDPLIPNQGHLAIIEAPLVWEHGIKGDKNVIVAVTDDGVDLIHPDLSQTIWENKKEIPGNGIDDDNNGYIDDISGWDFSDDDNNAHGGSHGTHVAGIIAATAGNGQGVVGTAAGVTIMPIRWYGGKNPWTTAMIVESYAYALNNGAKIINTSYNIDRLSNDKAYLEMVATLKKEGVLLFNSAGNNNQKNPARQNIGDITLVASTYGQLTPSNEIDTRSSFSNYGTGIDIAAPGGKIMSTCLGGKYCLMSGTSMASPNAAAVAAMIWSVYPTLSSEQVLHKLFTSSSNIDERNPEYLGLLGAGRINLAQSLSTRVRGAQVYPIGVNKNTGEFIFKVHGVLDSRFIKPLQKVQINGELFDAKMTYEGNILTAFLGRSLSDGEYQLRLNSQYLFDVFRQPAQTTQRLGQRASKSFEFKIQ